MVNLEAVVGQLYLTTLLGRRVSLYLNSPPEGLLLLPLADDQPPTPTPTPETATSASPHAKARPTQGRPGLIE